MISPSQDAFGTALLDFLEGRDVPELILEVEGDEAEPAMHPAWFFRGFEQWDWWDRELLRLVERGPSSIWGQERDVLPCTCRTAGCR
jgi:hypothetical protein